MTQQDMVQLLAEEVKGLDSYLDPIDYNNACVKASQETGFAFPISTDFKKFWVKERALRHIFFFLASESAHKFKFKQINLQHRFDHYWKLIQRMDGDWEKIQEERPDQFANVDTFKLFGTKVDAGFQYEPQTGRDFTYDEDNIVIFKPDEMD